MTASAGPVLITGGAGFLGQALTRALLGRGETVVTVDLHTAAGAPHPSLSRETGDIRDLDRMQAIADRHGVRAIVHLAALVIPACRTDPALGAEVNVIGHINMMELARRGGIARFVYTSSIAARPRAPYNSPVNLYGVFKQCCEEISKVYALDHGVPSIGLRPNVVYGPGRENGETAAVTLAMRAAAEGRAYEMPFSGAMCFQHLDEVIDILLRCLAVENDAPVVSDLTTRTNSIADVIAAIRAVRPDARITARPDHRAAPGGLDNAALRALLGDWQGVDLAEGVRRTIAAFERDRVP